MNIENNFICIDGNIGAGKSSVLLYLHKTHKYNVDLEPVDKWQNYLDKMYLEDKGYFEFQKQVWEDRCWLQSKDKSSTPTILERSPYFTRHTFVEVLKEKYTQEEYEIIDQMYNLTDKLWKPTKTFYIRTNPKVAYDRIVSRNRKSENLISLQYLQKLHNAYERAYTNAKNFLYVIDGDNKSVEQIAKEIHDNI
jgi:deoxyadenosine/deoxycytidine kinase